MTYSPRTCSLPMRRVTVGDADSPPDQASTAHGPDATDNETATESELESPLAVYGDAA
ncbi:hypothetical protein [Lapillicoccus sp.]|uniref:hypothetical protein n=1 Tax=Lapillicoccus sp. TaxID=1909287 RepID=UPI003982D6FF